MNSYKILKKLSNNQRQSMPINANQCQTMPNNEFSSWSNFKHEDVQVGIKQVFQVGVFTQYYTDDSLVMSNTHLLIHQQTNIAWYNVGCGKSFTLFLNISNFICIEKLRLEIIKNYLFNL